MKELNSIEIESLEDDKRLCEYYDKIIAQKLAEKETLRTEMTKYRAVALMYNNIDTYNSEEDKRGLQEQEVNEIKTKEKEFSEKWDKITSKIKLIDLELKTIEGLKKDIKLSIETIENT